MFVLSSNDSITSTLAINYGMVTENTCGGSQLPFDLPYTTVPTSLNSDNFLTNTVGARFPPGLLINISVINCDKPYRLIGIIYSFNKSKQYSQASTQLVKSTDGDSSGFRNIALIHLSQQAPRKTIIFNSLGRVARYKSITST